MTDTQTAPVSVRPVLVNMDPDGDLVLKIGAELENQSERHFRVCSSTMRRSSPVFKRMLFGPWKESKPVQGPWEVELPVDSPEAMEVILNIIHCRFDNVPTGNLTAMMSVDLVENILILTDKYDMRSFIRPWVSSWIFSTKLNVFWSPKSYEQSPVKVYIAWEFGQQEMFAEAVKNIIFAASLGDNGQLVVADGDGVMDLSSREHLGPLGLLDTITNMRSQLIQTVLDFFHRELDRLGAQVPVCTRTELHFTASARKMCDSAVFGGIWRELLILNPEHPTLPKKASDYPDSATKLFDLMTKLVGSVQLSPEHNSCSPSRRFEDFVKTTKENKQWTDGWLSDDYQNRMRDQRRKLGVFDPALDFKFKA